MKTIIDPYLVLNSTLADATHSLATCVKYVDNVSYNLFVETTDGTATLTPQVTSVDPTSNLYNEIVAAGIDPWQDLPVTLGPIAGADLTDFLDVNQTGSGWMRLAYTDTFVQQWTIETVADDTSSLNDTYFLIDGEDGTNYYVWFDVASAGTDPAIAGRTAIPVAIAEDATADTVAAALEAEIDDIWTGSSVSTDTVTLVGNAGGKITIADSTDAPTGFTFTRTVAPDGTIKVVVMAKGL